MVTVVTGKCFDHATVELVLIFSGGEISAGHVGEFSSVKSDTFSAEALGNIDVTDQADVGAQDNALSVRGLGRFVAVLLQSAELPGLVNLKTKVLFLDRIQGVDVDQPSVGVDDQAVFRSNILKRPTYRNYSRDPHRFGHDDGVSIFLSGFGDDGE